MLVPNPYERSTASGALYEVWLDQFVEVDPVITAPLNRLPLIIRDLAGDDDNGFTTLTPRVRVTSPFGRKRDRASGRMKIVRADPRWSRVVGSLTMGWHAKTSI